MDVPLGERELVDRARSGDEDAFEALIREHSARVFRLLVRILGDATSAEDAAQEAFVRAWRALPSFRAEARFSTWLYRIAVNEANRVLAKRSRQAELPLDETVLEVPDMSADPADVLALNELEDQLERSLAELPYHYRVAVVLRDVEGLTNEEAADMLGLNVRNFKSRLHRGRMALRERLERLYASKEPPSS